MSEIIMLRPSTVGACVRRASRRRNEILSFSRLSSLARATVTVSSAVGEEVALCFPAKKKPRMVQVQRWIMLNVEDSWTQIRVIQMIQWIGTWLRELVDFHYRQYYCHFMNVTAPSKPAVILAAPINVEESRAQRLQRQQARFRDRGGQVILVWHIHRRAE